MAEAISKNKNNKHGISALRTLYLYLVSIIGLITFIVGSVGVINNVLQTYLFKVEIPYYGSFMCEKTYYEPVPANPSAPKVLERTPAEMEECEEKQAEEKEQYQRNERGRTLSIAIAEMVVGLPVWLLHWGIIQRENRKKKIEA